MQKFPLEQITGANSEIKTHTSNPASREGLIELALCIRPDVLIFDTSIRGNQSWQNVVMSLRDCLQDVGFVAIVHNPDQALIEELARAQVNGIVSANNLHMELPHAIRAYQRNEMFLNPQFTGVLCSILSNITTTGQSQSQQQPKRRVVEDRGLLPTLTNREMEVLGCLTQGLNYKQISEKLFVSSSTVKTHVNNIFTKLNINDRTQAVLYGLRHGIEDMIPNLFGEEESTDSTGNGHSVTQSPPKINVQSLQPQKGNTPQDGNPYNLPPMYYSS